MKNRSRVNRVIISPEGKILKSLREKHGYSMREFGRLVGVTDSYISQIENGRTDAPKGSKLDGYLKHLGPIQQKYFYELVRDWKKETTNFDKITTLLPKLQSRDLKSVLTLVECLLNAKVDS